jgi:malate dehydrogenase (oxaloacetate-decarboxylating)
MVERPYELAWTPDGMVARVRLRGSSVLTSPLLNDGVRYQIAQANNALIFPGLGLGVTVCRARRISDQMLAAAARALADLSGAAAPGAALLPPVTSLRTTSAAVATAVAQAAQAEGLAQTMLDDDPAKQVAKAMWEPSYPVIEPI